MVVCPRARAELALPWLAWSSSLQFLFLCGSEIVRFGRLADKGHPGGYGRLAEAGVATNISRARGPRRRAPCATLAFLAARQRAHQLQTEDTLKRLARSQERQKAVRCGEGDFVGK